MKNIIFISRNSTLLYSVNAQLKAVQYTDGSQN
jgi:hypothetical protein